MMKLTALAVVALLAAGVFPESASAQSRPTAMTCDQYKKELSLAITKTRRADAEAKAEAELAEQAAQSQAYQQPEDKPAGAPARDYAGVERHRRTAEMACARRKYPEGIAEYAKAFGLLGVAPPGYLPQPAK
jgi:hypothetical protein